MLKGKNALITGASRGLGAAIAGEFLAMGASLALCSRSKTGLEKVLSQLQNARIYPEQHIFIYEADIAQEVQIDAMFEMLQQEMGALDILVNNAAIQGTIGPMEQNDWAGWKNTIVTDLIGTSYVCYKALPAMKRRGAGKIINLSGGGATGPRANYSAYATAKAGIVRLTETLAAETAGYGIDINAVAPGAMNGKMLEETLAAGEAAVGKKEYQKAIQQQKTGGTSPELAAKLCVYLASEQSNGISGKLFSAVWDDWRHLSEHKDDLLNSDIYTLRRIIPQDRGKNWN